jgi:RNA polymerase sigma-70 factor (ECF subfamily)
VALTAHDRELLRRCLHHEPGAWNDFVDRFLGLVYHVIQHTAHLRSFDLRPEDTEDIAAQVLVEIVDNDYATLRQFRGKCSLATYLTVIARRTCVQDLARRAAGREADLKAGKQLAVNDNKRQAGLESLEEVGKLLRQLPAKERSVVKLYYLEGRSYEEISSLLDIPVNSIGPILTRARKKLDEKKKVDERKKVE